MNPSHDRSTLTLRFYLTRRPRNPLRRDWRWQVVHPNGHVLAHGGQGYSRRVDAAAGAAAVLQLHRGQLQHVLDADGGRVVNAPADLLVVVDR